MGSSSAKGTFVFVPNTELDEAKTNRSSRNQDLHGFSASPIAAICWNKVNARATAWSML